MKTATCCFAVAAILLAALPAYALTRHVDVNSTNPVAPYTNWATAANVIQDAVDAAVGGDTVLVTNGVYAIGGKAVYSTMTNRVAVDKPLTLLSVNGPEFTSIQGYKMAGSFYGFGVGAIRCLYLTNGALVSGFTITNGATQDSTSIPPPSLGNGGGIYCASASAIITNCVIVDNVARWQGGGVHSGVLFDCRITGNLAVVGGGGAYQSILSSCVVSSNSATRNFGGGTQASTLRNCLVISNSAGFGAGGDNSTLVNCTVAHNNPMFSGGGVRGGSNDNCVIYYNAVDNFSSAAMNHCCVTPLPLGGSWNFTNEPVFVSVLAGNFHLQSNSPCINAGNNAYVTTTNDLDGNPRIVGGTVDMGAYEFQFPQSFISYAWLQQYGLPTDGSVDDEDGDNDQATTWQEWKAWTDPTNELSVLRMLSPDPQTNGTAVTWQSVVGHSYLLERATNGAASFSVLQSNIVGQSGTTTFTDTPATNSESFLYRVGVPE